MTITTRWKHFLKLSPILLPSRRCLSNPTSHTSFLAERHNHLVQRIQTLLLNVQSEFPILSTVDKKLLSEAQRRMDSIFSLVVVGEFNSGKSQFINSLLREKEICPTGVLPTTDTINIIRFGPKREEIQESEHLRSIYVPNEWLKQTNIVDTPGTNAILQSHQQITEHFIPQSDYVLFVTSVDRPFSESERLFLIRIHQWRKKVLIILNKIDQVRNEADRKKIIDYVEKNARQVLDDVTIPIFPLSALNALGMDQLEQYLRLELNDEAKLKLKLENPLGIVERIFDQCATMMNERKEILREDEEVIGILRSVIEEYRRQMSEDFKFQTNKIDNIFFRMTENLEEFLLENVQLSRFLQILFKPSSSAELKVQFNHRVNQNIEEDINQCIRHLCDWLFDRSNRTVHQLQKHLNSSSIHFRQEHRKQNEIDLDFSRSREQILVQLQSQSENILYKGKSNSGSQADELSSSIRSTMLGTAAIEVGAVGFGALAALASFDWTGLIGASLLGVLGLYFIPMRRSTIKREMKERIEKTRIELIEQLQKHFNIELDLNERKMRDFISPYVHFVQDEKTKLNETLEQIDQTREQIKELRLEIQRRLKNNK